MVSRQDPSELYGELFSRVQTAPVFEDSKMFVDMIPKSEPAEIMAAYSKEKPTTKDELTAFVTAHFDPPPIVVGTTDESTKVRKSIDVHIRALWQQLTRQPDKNVAAASSLIPLPYSYVVPGGRFREIYYWDSYFTQLGLLIDREDNLFQNMVRNFAHLVTTSGRIPNGNRDYYRSRSQPPFFSYMIALWRERFGPYSAAEFLPALKKEHEFWMSGDRAVDLRSNGKLNRYWDDRTTPRPEAFKEDVRLVTEAAEKLKRAPEDVYRDLRAGAESGWDYSTRWFKQPNDFASIQTTAYLPVDLNSLLLHLEVEIAQLSEIVGAKEDAAKFSRLAADRTRQIQTLFWDEKSGTFRDRNWQTNELSSEETIAMVVPLFAGAATPEQAKRVAKVIEGKFLKAGGVVTTLRSSGQQWDSPNGWAPHQWMAYAGLERYGFSTLAEKIRTRWTLLNRKVYMINGRLMEKYDVINLNKKSGGGEYPTQDGFGWTNGVYRALETPRESLRHLELEINYAK